jgi:hypothetical protein
VGGISDRKQEIKRRRHRRKKLTIFKRRLKKVYLRLPLRFLIRFFYAYVLRLGFLDGREGLLLHLYHSTYTSWKYAKAWQVARSQSVIALGRQFQAVRQTQLIAASAVQLHRQPGALRCCPLQFPRGGPAQQILRTGEA